MGNEKRPKERAGAKKSERGRGRPPKKGGPWPQITVRLPKSMLVELEKQAVQQRTTRTELARLAIKRYLLAAYE